MTTACQQFKQIKDIFEVKEPELKVLESAPSKRHQTPTLFALKNKGNENKFHSFFSFAEKLQTRWRHTKSVNYVKDVDSVLKNLKEYLNKKEHYFEAFFCFFFAYLFTFRAINKVV